MRVVDFSARLRSVEMTKGSLDRNDRREVRLVVLGWGHRERKGRESASGGAVEGTPGAVSVPLSFRPSGGVAGVEKSASTRRGTVRHDNVPSEVLVSTRLGTIMPLNVASAVLAGGTSWASAPAGPVSGPWGAGPSRSTRRRARDTRQSGRRREAKRAGASICAARRHRRACLCPCLTY